MCLSHNEACRSCNPEMELTRLSVNVKQETTHAILDLMVAGDHTASEITRRAIAVTDYFHKEKAQGRKIHIMNQDSTKARELVF